MTAKIMKANSETVHRSTYRGLEEDEKSNQAHISLRKELNNSIRDRSGLEILPHNFPDVNLEDTPLYDMYEEDKSDLEGGLAGKNWDNDITSMANELYRKIPMPEVNNKYVNSSVMFPRGDTYAEGKVIR